jgi:ABC-type nitrate/sulfonate/bicarbonate transport system substrate-binding protein
MRLTPYCTLHAGGARLAWRLSADAAATNNRRHMSKKIRGGNMKQALRIATALCAAAFASAAAWSDEAPKVLRFGWQAATPVTTFWAGFAMGSFEEQGLKIEKSSFNDNAPEIEALVSRQLDIATIAPAPTVQAISFGAPIKIISAVEYSFRDKQGTQFSAATFVARKDVGITALKDLIGKRVAIFGFSSNYYLALCDRLKEAGVDPKQIKFLSMPYTQMEGALVHNEVDAAVMTTIGADHASHRVPLTFLMGTDDLTKIALDMSQVIVARADWLQTHGDEAVRFLKGMLKVRGFIEKDVAQNGGAKIKAVVQSALKFSPETTEAFYRLRVASAGHELDYINSLDLPRATFLAYGQMLTGSGQLRGKPAATYEQLIDTSFLRKAHAGLGMTWDETKVGK